MNETIIASFSEANKIAKEIARLKKVPVRVVKQGDLFRVITPANSDLTPFPSPDGRLKEKEALLSLAKDEIDSYKQLIGQEKKKNLDFHIEHNHSIKELKDILLQKDKVCVELTNRLDELSHLLNLKKTGIEKFFNDLIASKIVIYCDECKSQGYLLNDCLICSGEAVKQEQKKNFDLCEACGGDGGYNGRCWKCTGTGYGEDTIEYRPCSSCNGSGVAKQSCDACDGNGMFGDEVFIKFLQEFKISVEYKLK